MDLPFICKHSLNLNYKKYMHSMRLLTSHCILLRIQHFLCFIRCVRILLHSKCICWEQFGSKRFALPLKWNAAQRASWIMPLLGTRWQGIIDGTPLATHLLSPPHLLFGTHAALRIADKSVRRQAALKSPLSENNIQKNATVRRGSWPFVLLIIKNYYWYSDADD